MDKVAILTFCNRNINYGQVLQAYAVQRIVKKYGFEPIIINYRKLHENENSFLLKNKQTRKLYEWYKGILQEDTGFFGTKLKFNSFVKKNIKLSYPCYTKSEIEDFILKNKIKFLLCGSDQIWNPAGFDPIYYLDFCNNEKDICRVAYAPSIAEDNINSRNIHIFQRMTALINKIDYVSVREEDSAKIIRTLTDKEVISLLDPTFLISKKGWDKIAAKRLCDESYIFCYIIGDVKQHKNNIEKIMQKYNTTKVVYLNAHETNLNDMFLKNIGPGEFISLIKYAKAVYTDSFHGVALSINLNKEFYTCKRFNMSAYNKESRIRNIINIFNLNNRYVDINGNIDGELINYEAVNRTLNKERRKAFNFLDRAFDRK